MEGLGEVKSYPLSDTDIRKILGKDIKIITYPQLQNFSNISQAFDRKGRCVMLYLTEDETSGHWVCMLNKKEGIEFFDPYGEPPEAPFSHMPTSKLQELDETRPYLTALLKSSGKPVFYNHYAFQKDKKDVNTCGRHSVVRCLYGAYPLEKYKKIMDDTGMTPDNFVSALTGEMLGK